jgi:hypothetical protein
MTLKHDADGVPVGSPIENVTLRGVMTDILGGFLVVRGFAKLSTLAARSEADTAGYQREFVPGHLSEIQAFYERGENLFFPEVVLSLELRVNFNKDGVTADAPLRLIRQGTTFKSNENGVSVKPTKTRTANDYTNANIMLPASAGKALKRIDGNHRITAFEQMNDVGYLDTYPVSFCIVLLPQGAAQFIEKRLFYNINSKAKPLTSEEIYRGIIEDTNGFPDDVLANPEFGPEFVLCRQAFPRLNFDYLEGLLGVFGKRAGDKARVYSVLIEFMRDLRAEGAKSDLPSVDVLLKTIKVVNASYGDHRLARSSATGLFSAFLFFALTDEGNTQQKRYPLFLSWVLSNHQYELTNIHAADLIRIFAKVATARSRQVFVSMQFSPELMPNFNAITDAVNELNAQHALDIKLRPIRIDQFEAGYSYKIDDEILRLIEGCGYLIADLTCGNKNVYHEIGYLMGLNQGKGLHQENFLLVHNDNISKVSGDIGLNLQADRQIRVSDPNELRKKIKIALSVFYGLSEEVEI